MAGLWLLVYGPTQGNFSLSKESWTCEFEAPQATALPAFGAVIGDVATVAKTLSSTGLVCAPEITALSVVTKATKTLARIRAVFSASKADTVVGAA